MARYSINKYLYVHTDTVCILVIHRLSICKFVFSLNFICNPQINTHSPSNSHSHSWTCTKWFKKKKKERFTWHGFSQVRLNKATPAYLFQLSDHKQKSFLWSESQGISPPPCIFVVFLGDFAAKNGHRHSKVLCNAPKPKKSLRCVLQRKCAWDKLHPGMSFSTVGHELDVSESITHIE